jgi:hypothetical protein
MENRSAGRASNRFRIGVFACCGIASSERLMVGQGEEQ